MGLFGGKDEDDRGGVEAPTGLAAEIERLEGLSVWQVAGEVLKGVRPRCPL